MGGPGNFHNYSLDGLRGLAALTVLISHFTNETEFAGGLLGHGAGRVGVAVFFVLSGYLMGRLYFDRQLNRRECLEFFRNRFARIAPLYFLAVLVAYGWFRATGSSGPFYAVNDHNIVDHLLFIQGRNVLWTIPVEVQFYAVFPLIWWLFQKTGRAVLLWMALISLAVAALGFPQFPVLFGYVIFFFLGIAVVFLPPIRPSRALDICFVLLMALYVFSFPRMGALFGLEFPPPWTSPLYMLLIPALLMVALHSELAAKVLANRPAVFLGTISYSIYVLHYPILHGLAATPLLEHEYLFLIVFTAMTIGLASASYFWFEKPVRLSLRGGPLAEPTVEGAFPVPRREVLAPGRVDGA